MPLKDSFEKIKEQMAILGIYEEDIIEKFILGSGSGGQKINKTASCVYLKHIPTGIEVKTQNSRSREDNRVFARQKLCQKIEGCKLQEKYERQRIVAKIRRQKRKRSNVQKEIVLASKKRHSEKKSARKFNSGKIDLNIV